MSKQRENAPHVVTVSILDKEYKVACPEEQEAELIASAAHLDEQMRAIREAGKVIGLERIAVMAALNITHDLMRAHAEAQQAEEEPPVGEVESLSRKIDEALFTLRQIEMN